MADCSSRNPGPAYKFGTLTGYEGHDYSKPRAPAFSLGLKTKAASPQTTPGPYSIGSVDRNGKYPYKGWTMESAAATRVKPSGPGPLDYAPEKMSHYTPAYSLGLKLPTRAPAFGPSAADYYPQPFSGGAPAYSIASGRKELPKYSSPGPQAATPLERYKSRAPAYSLGLSGRPMGVNNVGPGPKYYPTKMDKAYAYSFGLKHYKCAPPLITSEDRDPY